MLGLYCYWKRSKVCRLHLFARVSMHKRTHIFIHESICSPIHPFTIILFIHKAFQPQINRPSSHPSTHPPTKTPIHPQINPPTNLSTYAFIHSPTHPSIRPIHPSIHRYTHACTQLSTHPLIRLFILTLIHLYVDAPMPRHSTELS